MGTATTVDFLRVFDDTWPPDVLVDGSIKSRSATEMVYVSDLGYRISWTGTGLTYDEKGFGAGGTVTRVLVTKGGQTYADFKDLDVAMQRMSMFAFGFDREPFMSRIESDSDNLYEYMMRGADRVSGSAADDEISAGTGNDTILGRDGDDLIDIDPGDDSIDGGTGWDILTFRNANWVAAGAQGVYVNAALHMMTDAFGGHDTIANIEEFRDSALNDTLIGSFEDEEFFISRGVDFVDGIFGFDIVNFSHVDNWGGTKGVIVNLATGFARDSWGAYDRIFNVHGVVDTIFDDLIKGSETDDTFYAMSGKDSYIGRGGIDVLSFADIDLIKDSHGIVLDLNFTKNEVRDDGFGNKENLRDIEVFGGSAYADKLIGATGWDTLLGLDGNDTLLGNKGDDSLTGGFGRDVLQGGSGADVLIGSEGSDKLTGGLGEDSFRFTERLSSNGVDTITDFVSGKDDLILWAGWMEDHASIHLAAEQFRAGAGATSARTADHRVIYNTTTGDLYFDKDGTGTAAAVKIAVLEGSPTLSFLDIWTI